MSETETKTGKRTSAPPFAVRQGRMELFGRAVPLPAQRRWRVTIGIVLIFLGFLGFLPILGFWMIPLGLLVLSIDLAIVRRMRRRGAVRWGRRGAQPRRGASASRTAADLVDEAGRAGR